MIVIIMTVVKIFFDGVISFEYVLNYILSFEVFFMDILCKYIFFFFHFSNR
jgi:hypothetical protein